MPGPLSGFKVIELAAIGPVPFAGALLADMGADVVRIDRLPVPENSLDVPPRYDFYNRNKRSVALDLKRPEAVTIVLKLLHNADVLLEGFRPGVTERLGLSPEVCFGVNRRLVYGRMTGWGQDGPMAREVGHDINYLALTGALHSIGRDDLPPPPPLNLVADLGGGAMYLVMGVLAAAMEARGSGQGQVVDVAMIDGVASLMSAFHAFRQLGSWQGRNANIVDGGAHFYGTYETMDGKYISVGALEPHFYQALISVLGLSIETLPPQYDRTTWPAMHLRFAEIFRSRTRDDWVAAMSGHDACFAPVLTIEEAPNHPQMQARNVFTEFDGVLHPSPAPRFSRTPGTLRSPTPMAGQHNIEVLKEWGFALEEIEALQRTAILN